MGIGMIFVRLGIIKRDKGNVNQGYRHIYIPGFMEAYDIHIPHLCIVISNENGGHTRDNGYGHSRGGTS